MVIQSLWKGVNILNTKSFQYPINIVKLCSWGSNLFLLDSNHIIYYCIIKENVLQCIKKCGISAVDISFYNESLYMIDTNGRLLKINNELSIIEEISIDNNTECCSHGLRKDIQFKSLVANNNFGQLFISADGELWGTGNMPQIGLDSDSIKKVPFFEGRQIYSSSVGYNFAAVISRKLMFRTNTYTDNEDNSLFIISCSQCQNRNQNKLTLQAAKSSSSLSSICPLGIEIGKSSEESVDSSSSQYTQNKTLVNEGLGQLDIENYDKDSDNSPTLEEDLKAIKQLNVSMTEEKPDITSTNKNISKPFLSKQLSWVSAGEFIVECTENVSNFTSFMYKGVKTVGDRVATLSKVTSKSNLISDIELGSFEKDENILTDNANSLKNSESQLSTSTLNSENEFDYALKDGKIKKLSKLGKRILGAELWIWGDISQGQLGTGDTIKRLKPFMITSLSGLGVQKVSCGNMHCAALTLDGRVFLWGKNDFHQVTFDTKDQSVTIPTKFSRIDGNDRIRDVEAMDDHTVLFTHSTKLLYCGKHMDGYKDSPVNLLDQIAVEDDENSLNIDVINNFKSKMLTSDDITYCFCDSHAERNNLLILSIAQNNLEKMLLLHRHIVKPFTKKSQSITLHSNVYETVCDLFCDILHINALNTQHLWCCVEDLKTYDDIPLIKYIEEYIYIIKKYCVALSNLIVISGFANINNVIDASTGNICNLFSDNLPDYKQKSNKKISETVIDLAFSYPLKAISVYKEIVQEIIKKNETLDSSNNQEQTLNKIISILNSLMEEQNKKIKEADITRTFWEVAGKPLEPFRLPERRLIRESKSRPLHLVNPGRFSSHWFILFNDMLLHVTGNTIRSHLLTTLWVTSAADTESTKNIIQLTTPEDVILVCTPSEQHKTEWIHSFNSSIKASLKKQTNAFNAPSNRTASYVFSSKNPFYKDAKYIGSWLDGKMHGNGKVEWPNGRLYVGQFQHNTLCGYGKMEIPDVGLYEGHWKDNLQDGYGIMKYVSGDTYEGYFSNGLRHGHGVMKRGDLTSATSTIYTGEWVNGVKQGYGVIEDIGKGEKYLGSWSDDKKHGCGLIVTLDGIYYEGIFVQNVLVGHGIMVFENGTHYEGEFKSIGTFSGKGVLTLSSRDKMEGSMSGSWTEGIKISNGVMNLNTSNPKNPPNLNDLRPDSFGKLCVAANQKWNALFRHYFQCIGVPDTFLNATRDCILDSVWSLPIDNAKIWQNIAVAISYSLKHQKMALTKIQDDVTQPLDLLEVIPKFGQSELNLKEYLELKQYLKSAWESNHHPLGQLLSNLTNAFNTTYGGVRVHPLLLSHAVKELKSITSRIYGVVRILFPGLPKEGSEIVLPYNVKDDAESINQDRPIEGEVVSTSEVVERRLLPRAHPALFVLYALHNSADDARYWRRLLDWNKHSDLALMAFLGIHRKFWVDQDESRKELVFRDAVETLQQVKTTFSPVDKLMVIRDTFHKMTGAVEKKLGNNYLWSMDELFPVFQLVVVRARILQLGSEIHFIEDFLDPGHQNGELGIMFTTLKACYFQILQEKTNID